jgi:methanogenic corrinoid protein MtbC1
VSPDRTDSNRRVYSDADIERLILLRRATEAGESIGQIADMDDEGLRQMTLDVPASPVASAEPRQPAPSAKEYLNSCLEAIEVFDAPLLQNRLTDASLTLGRQALLDQLLHPLMDEIGRQWNEGKLRVAHEHLASAVVRSLLGTLTASSPVDDRAPVIIATTPAGQLHEFGALMAAATAASVGWRILYLGPNTPAENIAAAARDSGASVVALSLIYPPDDSRIADELRRMGRLLPDSVSVIAGGRAWPAYRSVLEQINAKLVNDLPHFRQVLEDMRMNLTSRERAG